VSKCLEAVGRGASRGATKAGTGGRDGGDVALDVMKKGVAPEPAMKDEPCCDNERAMDGVVQEALPKGSEIKVKERRWGSPCG
jgi:hypothetical protein